MPIFIIFKLLGFLALIIIVISQIVVPLFKGDSIFPAFRKNKSTRGRLNDAASNIENSHNEIETIKDEALESISNAESVLEDAEGTLKEEPKKKKAVKKKKVAAKKKSATKKKSTSKKKVSSSKGDKIV